MTTVTVVGAYRVLEKLGEGGMGSVYLGEHSLLGRRAAIKVLHPMFTTRSDIVERFFNEARAATSIQDPGIVQVFDFGFHDEIAYIVMEHLVGETLQTRLRRLRRLPEAEVLRHTRQIALSLHAAHACGVIHRDLKPDNVFVVADPEAAGGERTKILDFGIAKLVDNADRNRTQTGLVLGTPSYMSPEQCRGSGTVDHRADIYSLGCMMFRFLTGRLVFDAEGSGDLIAMHLREPARPPSAVYPVRPELDAIVLRCLAKNPDERYQTMRDLAADLDQLLRAISVPPGTNLAALTPLPPPTIVPTSHATPVTTPQVAHEMPTTLSSGVGQRAPASVPGPRRWPLIAAIAVVLIAGGAISIVATTSRGGDEEPRAASVPIDPAPTASPTASSTPVPTAAPTPAPIATVPTATAAPSPPPAAAPAQASTPQAAPTATPPPPVTATSDTASTPKPKPKKPRGKESTTTSSPTDSLYDDR